MTIRLVTWNIAAARVPGGVGMDEVISTLRGLDADLIAIQEVDRGIGRSGHEDQPRLLGEALGMASCHFAPALRSRGHDGPWEPAEAPGRDTGASSVYGIVLLSRLPLEDVTPCPLPFGPPYPGQEQRVALAATVRAGDCRLTVAATHLDRRPDRAALQLRYLQEWLTGRPAPRMLLGDLNLRPSRVALASRPGWRRAVKGLTHPAGRPRRQIDHVLLDSPSLRVRAGLVVATRVSDHRAVLVEVELPE